MKPATLLESINLKVELIPEGKSNRPGTSINPSKITIHNTSNDSPGADANAHSRFVREKGYYILKGKKHSVSWHYTVDDRLAIRHLPNNEKSFHAGTSGNKSSIAIEICMHTGINQEAANNRAARLSAFLLHEHDLSIDDLVTHQSWTGKKCPVLLVESNTWSAFKKMVEHYLNVLQGIEEMNEALFLPEEAEFEFKGYMCWEEEDVEAQF